MDDDTDFTLMLGEYRWRVHVEVLTHESQFFRALLKGNWKVCSVHKTLNTMSHIRQESQEKCVELHDDEPLAVARLLQFLYAGYYCSRHLDWPGPHGLRTHSLLKISSCETVCCVEDRYPDTEVCYRVDIQMLSLADKYGIPALTNLVVNRFKNHRYNVITRLKLLAEKDVQTMAERCPDFKEAVAMLVAKNFKLLREGNSYKPIFVSIATWLEDDFHFTTQVMEFLAGSK